MADTSSSLLDRARTVAGPGYNRRLVPPAALAAAGAGFMGLLSLFNLLGRFFWSSALDKMSRKVTYPIYFGLAWCFMPWRPCWATLRS